MSFFHELSAEINQAMQFDKHRLRNRLRGIEQTEERGGNIDRPLDEFLADLRKSTDRHAAREKTRPTITYDPQLPVVARREEIAAAIREYQVVILCGETGSGKSTQLPKICLEIGRGVSGMIGHTQPRRIAARSVAARVAEELNTELGTTVGFKVRFNDDTSANTLIKLMTDGVLLAESQHDRFFDHYDTLIIDEAHERSLNIDFLMGYLKRLLPRRADLKLIITSATIDATRFAEHFGQPAADGTIIPAPVIEVTGRTFPVDVLYRPLQPDEQTGEVDPIDGVVAAVEEVTNLGYGDVLVFLPTERDILATHQRLRGWEKSRRSSGTEILPLYARLSNAEQQRVFRPHNGRRIVLATNVAESSLTVPGIRFVIDTGVARISRYSPRSKMQRLPIEAISQASADQRKGRCGRVGPGICIRLFDEDDFAAREKYTPPEIQRTNLAAVILQTQALGLGQIDEFPFLDAPRPESIRDGYRTLFEIGALNEGQELTPIGRQLARLPVDPRIGRMLFAAHEEHCLADLLIIAAALESQDPRDRPVDKQQMADQAHAQFVDPDSDFLSYLRMWDFYHDLKVKLSKTQLRKACKQNFLSDIRMHEWQDLHRQLMETVMQAGMKPGRRRYHAPAVGEEPNKQEVSQGYAAIHRSLLTGLLSSIALRGDTNEYTAAGNQKVVLWPGSGVFQTKPKWIVAGELIETTRRYARTTAKIDPDWLEHLATHLVTRSYSEPHWDPRNGATMAFERVTLFGLTIIPKRRIRYSGIDPVISRDMLIRHGLVTGEITTRGEFLANNRRVLEEIEKLSAKTRRRDWLVDEDRIVDFYDQRLPPEITDAAKLDQWRREAEKKNPHILFLKPEDVLAAETNVEKEHYPDQIEVGKTKLKLDYRFEPGDTQDGVTLTVSQLGLRQLSPARLGWLIPGLLEDKLQALIRSLPKNLRRNLVPAPDVARRVASELKYGEGEFLAAVADALSQISGEPIPVEAFDEEKLPPYLRMNVRVVDPQGKSVAEGRDLPQLMEKLGVNADPLTPPVGDTPWHRDNVTRWDFPKLPKEVEIPARPHRILKYVAIIDQGETAALRLADSAEEAQRLSRSGIRQLLVLAERRELKAQVDWLPDRDKLALHAAAWCRERAFQEQVMDFLADRAWRGIAYRLPESAEEFELLRKDFRREIVPAVAEIVKLLKPICETFHRLRLALDEPRPATWQPAILDMQQQLQALTPTGFLLATPAEWLDHLPRYLQAMWQRLQKLSTALPRDRQQQAVIQPFVERLSLRTAAHAKRGIFDPELATFRWLLEEFRVSLFAQELGTAIPVSPQRLEKQWAKVRSG